ncbi:hypothetical protein EYF80_004760 [Liparis tanakae]|uniref:Uncharacterized protein n=1 Tax=Liparis tanakae TaxID=230148 RepID=A0A4Z2J4J5_9TELE|nr:hypothetical protein EYF80_004760 [Liparis tanakae]
MHRSHCRGLQRLVGRPGLPRGPKARRVLPQRARGAEERGSEVYSINRSCNRHAVTQAPARGRQSAGNAAVQGSEDIST